MPQPGPDRCHVPEPVAGFRGFVTADGAPVGFVRFVETAFDQVALPVKRGPLPDPSGRGRHGAPVR